jgi:hypothetical protein
MVNNPCSNHVQVDINHAPYEMFSALNSGGVITVFPECPFAAFSLIVFLAATAGHQLQGPWQNVTGAAINYQEMDMVRGDHIIQNLQPVTLLRLKQPVPPSLPVSQKPKKKLLLMAAMSKMPDLPWNIIAIRPWHFPSFLTPKSAF